MTTEFFSNHSGSSSELTLLADVIPGYAPCRSLITYSARLRRHLRMLGALRRVGLEGRRAGVYTGPIDALRTLQYVRWTLVDNDTRMLLAVNFDRPFEPYVRRIVDVAGPLLDTILCHCEGFDGCSSDQGFDGFMEFAMRHQAPVELFAAASPDLSVDDGDYYLQRDADFREDLGDPDVDFAEHRFETINQKLNRSRTDDPLPLLDQALNIINILYENEHLFPETNSYGQKSRDDLLYYRLAERLTPGFWNTIRGRFDPANVTNIANRFDLTRDEVRVINERVDKGIEDPTSLLDSNMMSNLSAEDTDRYLASVRAAIPLLSRYSEARNWFAAPPAHRDLPAQTPRAPGDIQAGLLTKKGARPKDIACMLLFRVDDADGGRAFLSAMESALWPDTGDEAVTRNLSITLAGFDALKIDPALRASLPPAFREGMAARAGLLGDIDVNSPTEWEWPRLSWTWDGSGLVSRNGPRLSETSIDIIVQIAAFAKDGDQLKHPVFHKNHPLAPEVAEIAGLAAENGVRLTVVEAMQRNVQDTASGPRVFGHIGFADGISQPRIAEKGEYAVPNDARGEREEDDQSLLGDLLIGHRAKLQRNFAADPSNAASGPPYLEYDRSSLQDGTFQVVRKIAVSVAEFNKVAEHLPNGADKVPLQELQERMIGRRKDGRSLPAAAGKPPDQDFNYLETRGGNPHDLQTPLQSHVRRANPRKADTPRILRRGFSYGPFGDGETGERGMMFVAYNANIAEQFEVVQRWISGGNSTGISSWHGDPLLAPKRAGGSRSFRYVDGGKVVRVNLPAKPPAILKWGIYAFTPSRAGLRSLAEGGDAGEKRPLPWVGPKQRRLQNMDAAASATEWKLLVEDIDDERREDRERVWRQIRDQGGVLKTDYGVLVGGADAVRDVLTNADAAFSVRRYWERMKKSIGVQYLGKDDPPTPTEATDPEEKARHQHYLDSVSEGEHKRESGQLSAFFNGFTSQRSFDEALAAAKDIIAKTPNDDAYLPTGRQDAPAVKGLGRRIQAERFFYDVAARLCWDWFGLNGENLDMGGPEGANAHCPIDLVRGSFYTFWPDPIQHHVDKSQKRTKMLVDEMRTYTATGANGPSGSLLEFVRQLAPPLSNDRIAKTIAGAAYGFAGPTSGSFRAVLYDWIDSGFLWRAQQQIADAGGGSFANAKDLLLEAIVESMARRAAPDILHRVAVKKTALGGSEPVEIEPGDTVVVSLRSACEERPDERLWHLFGGDYGVSGNPIHACPGRQMGLYAIAGTMVALMEAGDIEPEGPLSFRIC